MARKPYRLNQLNPDEVWNVRETSGSFSCCSSRGSRYLGHSMESPEWFVLSVRCFLRYHMGITIISRGRLEIE